ncbi:MAG: cupin [Telmatospirillum sp.]|nr:cupin [Telmatospirillum sp.]
MDNRSHREFHPVDPDDGWQVPSGYPDGIQQKVLAGGLDEGGRRGLRTRLLRFDPGSFTTRPFVHDYWEEVVLVSGDLEVGGQPFTPLTYACRPPGVAHGPFRSVGGCVLFEVHYFGPGEGDPA